MASCISMRKKQPKHARKHRSDLSSLSLDGDSYCSMIQPSINRRYQADRLNSFLYFGNFELRIANYGLNIIRNSQYVINNQLEVDHGEA